MSEKPHKGEIHDWHVLHFKRENYPDFPENLGFVVIGKPKGHPDFRRWMKTSAVVKCDRKTGEIETLNSRYRLIPPEKDKQ